MIDFSAKIPLSAYAMLLSASDPIWHRSRRPIGPISLNAVFRPFAVFVALIAISAIAAAAHPLNLADVLNQF
jgi:hypothetical protein